MAPKDKHWTRLIPFTRSWHERRKARRHGTEIMGNVSGGGVAKEADEDSPPALMQPTPATKLLTPTATAPSPQTRTEKAKKSLAQYAHHDNKGAVGWVAPSSVNQPHPQRQYVQGQRTLAQYGHHDNKWAVKHPVY